ncbi:hypothetical protein ACSHT2_13925 [Bradyrhizobium sp. PUT101]|uniref:hypothetical protein n=1 Tax=Bradyrhizobium sp. PUT101 TaxID=3447427 RepID=UPI003F830379
MDHDTLLRDLAMVERHVALGAGHVAKQEAMIAGLERKGHDTVNARTFLTTLREWIGADARLPALYSG